MRRVFRATLVTAFLAMTLSGAPVQAQQEEQQPPPSPSPAPAKPAPAEAPAAPMVDQVKILCDDKAKNDGEIRFVFTPAGGEAKEIRVTIQKGMKKQATCRDVAKELKVALGPGYEVDQYDDDKVKVEGKKDEKFSLTLGIQTASGLTIRLK